MRQADESSLVKVMIQRESFSNPTLAHKDKAAAINERPIEVRARFEELPGLLVECLRDEEQLNVQRGDECVHEGDHARPGHDVAAGE